MYQRGYVQYGGAAGPAFGPQVYQGVSSPRGFKRSYKRQMRRLKSKHSGASFRRASNGKDCIQGWIYRKKTGITSFVASSNGNLTQATGSHAGGMLIYGIKFTTGTQQNSYAAIWDERRRCLTVPQIGFGIYPQAPNGGFCGYFHEMKNSKRSKRRY